MGAAIQVAGKGIKAYAFSMDAMDDINNITLGKAITEIVQQLLNPDTPRGRFST
jgi:broad specificity polyphosphatase/5'/3'-nucleotidase SurE